MPKLTLNYCSIADVEIVEPKPDDPQKKNRKVTLLVDEENLFEMLDNLNPQNIIKYLDMRQILHREPSNIVVKVRPDASWPKLRKQLKRIRNELKQRRKQPENATADPNDGQQTETETNNQITN
jgi:hypothetical protein